MSSREPPADTCLMLPQKLDLASSHTAAVASTRDNVGQMARPCLGPDAGTTAAAPRSWLARGLGARKETHVKGVSGRIDVTGLNLRLGFICRMEMGWRGCMVCAVRC